MTELIGFIVRCAICRALAKTPSGLPPISWRKINDRWYCAECERETRP